MTAERRRRGGKKRRGGAYDAYGGVGPNYRGSIHLSGDPVVHHLAWLWRAPSAPFSSIATWRSESCRSRSRTDREGAGLRPRTATEAQLASRRLRRPVVVPVFPGQGAARGAGADRAGHQHRYHRQVVPVAIAIELAGRGNRLHRPKSHQALAARPAEARQLPEEVHVFSEMPNFAVAADVAESLRRQNTTSVSMRVSHTTGTSIA